MINITAVERDCGLPKDTLRVWERRYGFPKPERDVNGERIYPDDQVRALRLLRRLIGAGHRPGKIVGQPLDVLTRLASELHGDAAELAPEAKILLSVLRDSNAQGLRELLSGMLLRLGLRAFTVEVAPVLTQAVGAAWARGELEIHQEHLFTEQFSAVLRGVVNAARGAGARQERPIVLLTTFPQEPHGLGLLMVEAMLLLAGCGCVSLGVQMPVSAIALAARAHRADILALSFSSLMSAAQSQSGLAELRALAPDDVEIWVGGACASLRESIEGVRLIRALDAIAPAIEGWQRLYETKGTQR